MMVCTQFKQGIIGMTLYVERLGTGPDLVLLHGWGMNGAVFDGVKSDLSRQFKLHIIDLPGYGYSANVGGQTHTLDSWLDLLLQVLPERAHLLGWSLGGMLAMRLAMLHPERVLSLLTVASSPRFVAEMDWPGVKPEVLVNFSALLLADTGKTIERFLAIQAMGSQSARDDVRKLRERLQSRPAPGAESLRLGLSLLQELDLRAELSALTCPSLHLFGRLDALVPAAVWVVWPRHDQVMSSHLFLASSHAPFITESNEFVAVVSEFITAQTRNALSSLNDLTNN
jgi:pimeloyl-[acyl-carrier protein] methyl ester esterase